MGRSLSATTMGVSMSGKVPTIIANTSPHIDVARWYTK
jgi:hypothetical protein